jgi:hypothetical protein
LADDQNCARRFGFGYATSVACGAPWCDDEVVRTTIDLTSEAYHTAKAIARERDQSLGTVVSELILLPRSGAAREGAKSEAGFPLFSSGRPVTAEDVQSILDEEPELV